MWQIVVDIFVFITGATVVFLLCNHQLRITRLEKMLPDQRVHDERLSAETENESRALLDMGTPSKQPR